MPKEAHTVTDLQKEYKICIAFENEQGYNTYKCFKI